MYDQSYNKNTLTAALRRGDFRNIPVDDWETFRETSVAEALESAKSGLADPSLIQRFHLKKSPTFRAPKIGNVLVIRKLTENIRRLVSKSPHGRSFAVRALIEFLREGVPYRVYRLDVKTFYESFQHKDVLAAVRNLRGLSPQGKAHFDALYGKYMALGGTGLPRGMEISAVLADLLMRDFDSEFAGSEGVYFYHRYVDDIVIVTNRREDPLPFLRWIRSLLPAGLELNDAKTRHVDAPECVSPVKIGITIEVLRLCYLGYEFIVTEPVKVKGSGQYPHRNVRVEIAPNKVERMKSRIVRSIRDFQSSGDATLLIRRVRCLTSNYAVRERATGRRKLAGIYFSYPLLSRESQSLRELDRFLATAILGNLGRPPHGPLPLAGWQKRTLIGQSFVRGHSSRYFVHYNDQAIAEIQECWKHE